MTTNASSAVTTGDRSTENDAKKMDPALKAKWVEALRSGEYEQGTMYLRRDPGLFCCLGVLCDVAGLQLTHNDQGISNGVIQNDESADDYQPIYDLLNDPGAEISRTLWKMNDGYGVRQHSFPEIADYIEANL